MDEGGKPMSAVGHMGIRIFLRKRGFQENEPTASNLNTDYPAYAQSQGQGQAMATMPPLIYPTHQTLVNPANSANIQNTQTAIGATDSRWASAARSMQPMHQHTEKDPSRITHPTAPQHRMLPASMPSDHRRSQKPTTFDAQAIRSGVDIGGPPPTTSTTATLAPLSRVVAEQQQSHTLPPHPPIASTARPQSSKRLALDSSLLHAGLPLPQSSPMKSEDTSESASFESSNSSRKKRGDAEHVASGSKDPVTQSPDQGDDKRDPKSSHVCVECDKTFTRRSGLLQHLQAVHQGERPYECPQCGGKFSQRSGLKEHFNVVHKKIRNHICSICGKAFGKNGDLQRHIAGVHRVSSNQG